MSGRSSGTPQPGDVSLDGRVVVVTGAAQGIGRAVAETVAAFGADVALADRDDGVEAVAERIRSTGRRVTVGHLDVRDRPAVQAFAEQVDAELGDVHGLVNNAGGTFVAEFMSGNERGDAALVAENFTSVLDVTRAVVPLMRTGGAIVNVTSSEAFQAAPGFAVYASMKAATEELTRTLALELAEVGIRVNAVAPDGMPTPGDETLAAQVAERSRFVPPPRPPWGGFAAPEAAAGVVAFLLGDLAGFVTGASVSVDGGLRAAGGWHLRS